MLNGISSSLCMLCHLNVRPVGQLSSMKRACAWRLVVVALSVLIALECCAEAANEQQDNSAGALWSEPRLLESVVGAYTGANAKESKQYTGYFKLDRTHDARMFYYYFESRGDPAKDPLVLWMTGGPGCSSSLAVFYENGPWDLHENYTLSYTEYGWDKAANMIFVDQPIDTGFSYSQDPRDVVTDEEGVAEDMYDFLQEFLAVHTEVADRDFYITGESYGGHYVPAVANRIYTGNKAIAGSSGRYTSLHTEWKRIELKGLAIGNGLTNPEIQYGAYADYALRNNLITEVQRDLIQIFDRVLEYAGDINVYDIRLPCTYKPLCYDFSLLDRYLNLPETQAQLGVKRKFVECTNIVSTAMAADIMKNLEPKIPPMLEDGIQVLIYAGDKDLICNWLGNYLWVSGMQWSGKLAFNSAKNETWTVEGDYAGELKSAQGLTFLRVASAGHMVPMDQPKHTFAFFKAFINGKPIGNGEPDMQHATGGGIAAAQ
eukprot:jgi/Chlat1/3859/Chrsp26S00302